MLVQRCMSKKGKREKERGRERRGQSREMGRLRGQRSRRGLVTQSTRFGRDEGEWRWRGWVKGGFASEMGLV